MNTERKVAVVTGASQGIGAGIVEAFRRRDYGVVGTSRSIKPSDDAEILTVPGDVRDPRTAQRVFSAALERFGRVDTLVNNAGMFMAKPFTAYTQADYEAYVATNVSGFFHMTQRALDVMSKQRRGHVITITTSLVDQPSEQRSGCAGVPHERRLERGHAGPRDRVREHQCSRQRCLTGHHQDADASA